MKILSYNALAGFGEASRNEALAELVENINPDVAFFSEGYRVDQDPSIVEESLHNLGDLGYEVVNGNNNTIVDRTDRNGFIGIVRQGLGRGAVMRTGTYQGFIAEVYHPESRQTLDMGGIHLEDRSEAQRLVQVAGLPELDTLMGDLNSMHGADFIARALRAIKPFTNLLPTELDTDPRQTNKLQQIASLAYRFPQMATGRTLELLSEYGLEDADPSHQATIHGVAQLDHILHVDSLRPVDYRVHKEIDLSDHKPITVSLEKAA